MDIKKMQEMGQELIHQNRARNKEYNRIDNMINGVFELPEAIQSLEFIGNRKYISLAPRNAAMSAIRSFATHMPDIRVEPTNDIEEEWERAERMETALEWDFKQINVGRGQPPHWKIVESAVKYCNVSMQTEYYPYSRKSNDKRSKFVKNRGNSNFIVHHPSNVHGSFSDDTLELALLAQERRAADVLYQWENVKEASAGVAELKRQISDTTDGANRKKHYVSYYDFTDFEERLVFCTTVTQVSSSDLERNIIGTPIVLINEKHKLPFIPWAIVDNNEPILKNVYDTWVMANIIKTIKYAKHISLAAHPSYWVKVLSPSDDVAIDNTDPNNKLTLTAGQEAGVMQPPPLDPQLMQSEADLDSQIHLSSVAAVLGSVESLVGGNSA